MLSRLTCEGVPGTAWAGKQIICLKETDSTNRCARSLARSGATHGTLVVADSQTEGRGRRGRSWMAPSGDAILLSLILRPQLDVQHTAWLSLAAALAAALAIRSITGLDAQIKWPNDLVINGKKVCGILLEMEITAEGAPVVTVGVGINVHQTAFEPELAGAASSLDLEAGKRFSRTEILRAFLQEMEAVLALPLCGDDFMRRYRACSATLGRRVQVQTGEGAYTATALGLSQNGALLVRADEDGLVREVLAADVSVRGIMGYV